METEAFEKDVESLLPLLKQLVTAKEFLKSRHSAKFASSVFELAQCLLKQLESIEVVFRPWSFYTQDSSTTPFLFVGEIATMMRTVPQWNAKAQTIYDQIDAILASHIDQGKCQEVRKKLDKETRENAILKIEKASKELKKLTSREEVVGALIKLLRVMNTIQTYSVEFGMALLHHNGRLGSNHLESPGTAPEVLPRDPFVVGGTVAVKAQETLGIQTKKLAVFVREGCGDSAGAHSK